MTRRARWLALTLGGAALLAAAPFGLRHMAFFHVRQVEVVGVRFLDPAQIVEALALAADQNLFDPTGDAAARVAALPGVVQASVHRRVPGTLRVTVFETEPIALAPTSAGMVPLACDGAALPYDPARAGLDLPIVERADSALVRALCVVRVSDSALYASVQTVRGGSGGGVMLDLGEQRVRLNASPSTTDVAAVGLVQRHLAERGQVFAELDARFDGLVFARGRRS